MKRVDPLKIAIIPFLVNLGALSLQALFEHWPSTHTFPIQEETRTIEKGSPHTNIIDLYC
jgi:hypothetical protein